MNEPLFRQEAVDHQRERLWGEVVLTQPLSLRVVTLLLAAGVVLAVIYLSSASYTRKVTTQGYVRPAAGLIQVYPARAGYITAVHVAAGDQIEQGMPLASIDTGMTLADGSELGRVLIGLLGQQKAQLEERILRHDELRELKRTHLQTSIDGLAMKLEQTDRSLALQQERIRLQRERYEALAAVKSSNLVSDDDVQARYQSYLDARQEEEALLQAGITAQAALADSQYELRTLNATVDEQIYELRAEITRIEQQIARESGDGAYVVRAPVSGRVSGLQFQVGNRVPVDRPLLSVVPDNAELIIELLVPSEAIGFVDVTQNVDMRYDAFPYERFGMHSGEVTQVASTVLSPAELVAPVSTDRPVYLVRVNPESTKIKAYGEEFALQSGMTLQADIHLDTRPLYQWLLRPLFSLEGTL